jgi:hypothetical protein
MLWLNLSLGMIFVLAICGIPLWMVIRYPDTAPDYSDGPPMAEPQAGTTATRADVDRAA